jgi:hypothetical protein
MIAIFVEELPERHGRFVARLGDGSVVVPSSRQPFLDAARVLLAEGADPAGTLVMMRGQMQSLSAPIGAAAKLTVRETDAYGPRFAAWIPWTEDKRAAYAAASARTGDKTDRGSRESHVGSLSDAAPAATTASRLEKGGLPAGPSAIFERPLLPAGPTGAQGGV